MTDLSIVAIIPLYNGARWIESAIRSVFEQTLQPDEFVVVDDGSTDGGAGAAIVERLAKERPITLLHKPNGGQSSARNFAVRHSKSTLIALLDQDDEWYPNHLEKLIEPFHRHNGRLGWAYSNLDVVTENGDMFCRDYLDDVHAEQPKRHLLRCLSEDMHILPSAALISRIAFEAESGFDERLAGYEDDDLFLRLFRARWENIYLPQSLSFWRMNNSSCSYSPRMAKSRMIYMEKLLKAFPDDKFRGHFYARDCIAPRFLSLIMTIYGQSLRNRDIRQCEEAVENLKRIIPLLPRKVQIKLRLQLPFLQSPAMAHVMFAVKPYLARVYRMVFA